MMQRRALVFTASSIVALAACGGGDKATSSGQTTSATVGTGSGATTGTGSGGAGAGGAGGSAPLVEKTLTGDVTWQATFDATAKTAGATDCSYTRHYEGVEDTSAPWLCPSCEVMYQAKVTMTSGQADCFSQLSTTPPAASEWIGYGNGTWWRSTEGPTTAQGTVTMAGSTVTTANTVTASPVTAGGTVDFKVSGSLTLGQQDGDPIHGFVAPTTYACGWPKADPAPYTGNYVLAKGSTLPDGLFKDKCGETVRLHDFAGKYLIVDMAAMDCGPCQQMAGQEEQLKTDMAAKGIDLQVITLLCPSLSNVFGQTSPGNLKTWINNFTLTSPVLGDRGWGMAIFEPAIGTANIGYPSWAIVGPDLKVLDFQTGYPTTLAAFETIITTAAGSAP